MFCNHIFSNRNYWLKVSVSIIVIICLCCYSVCKGKKTEVFIEDCLKNPSLYDNRKLTLYGGHVTENHAEYIYYENDNRRYRIDGISLPASKERIDISVILKEDSTLIYQDCRKSNKFKPIYKDLISLLALFITVGQFFHKYKIGPSGNGLFIRRKK